MWKLYKAHTRCKFKYREHNGRTLWQWYPPNTVVSNSDVFLTNPRSNTDITQPTCFAYHQLHVLCALVLVEDMPVSDASYAHIAYVSAYTHAALLIETTLAFVYYPERDQMAPDFPEPKPPMTSSTWADTEECSCPSYRQRH
jgi:hypothetical protein